MKRPVIIITISCLAFMSSAAAYAETRGDCLEAVKKQQEDIYRQYVDDSVQHATSIYEKKSSSFGELSCLDNIMNSGADIFFSPPSLGDIVGKMKAAACGAVDAEFNNVKSAIGSGTNASLPIGDLIPGVNLGSIGGGFSLSQSAPNTVNSNITSNVSKVTNEMNSILGNN